MEAIIIIIRLPYDLQKIILNKIIDNDFRSWYYEVVTRSNRYFDIHDPWGQRVTFPNNTRVAALTVNPNPIRIEGQVTEWIEDHYKA